MKVPYVLTIFAFVVACSVNQAAGAECTVDDAEKLVPLLTKIVNDENCLNTKKGECPNAECLKTMATITNDLPDCTSEGKNVKTEYAAQLKKCSTGSGAAAPFSATTAVVLSSAAVAVAAVFL